MSVGIIGRRNTKHRRNRRMSGQNTVPVKATPISIVGTGQEGTVLTLTFDQPVALKGLPKIASNVGALPTQAVLASPNSVALTYPAGVLDSVTVPFEDPAIRNMAGGYLLAGVYPLI